MAKILLTTFLLFIITNNINGLSLARWWKEPNSSMERVQYIGNSLRPGRPLKRSNYDELTDFHPMGFNMIGDEAVFEFVPQHVWQLYHPKRIFLRNPGP